MGKNLQEPQRTMGTLPVFMTAISTILGAILYLRFGYAIGHTGLLGTLMIILLGHLVTIPTAMAVAEIATNQKVEGGGAYYMISRSFGLNIGAAIGIALFLSQAISVAFYIIAFTVSFEPVAALIHDQYGIMLSNKVVGLTAMGLLTILMLTKGADVGVKALYLVVAVIFVSLVMFFMGGTYSEPAVSFSTTVEEPDDFFKVFTIIFPAFTGIAAGLGLSGDLKDPKKSIPRGTMLATFTGIVVYILVAFKLYYSASPEDLGNTNILIMEKIAIWGPIIPIGLAAAAISSALGSIMIAPRTLQALGLDDIFPKFLNDVFSKGRKSDNEPINAILLTSAIGFFFISIGDIDFVAEIIAMFFMVTYGVICLISFLEHFGANPSYRPTFQSKWYFSLAGTILCFWLMFKMKFTYALLSVIIMSLIYIFVKRSGKRSDVAELVKGVIFQLNRRLQIFLQKRNSPLRDDLWRPFIICISKDTFKRRASLDLTGWFSFKYGFGTYIHLIEGFLDKKTYQESKVVKDRLLKVVEDDDNRVFLDTVISPSLTSAIAQSIQLSGVSGNGNNMIMYEYAEADYESLSTFIGNHGLMRATEFDVCILRSTLKGFGHYKEIHVWISPEDYVNANLMVLLAYILLGHPKWKQAEIKIFAIHEEGQIEVKNREINTLIKEGRIPISPHNVSLVERKEGTEKQELVDRESRDADLTIIGFGDSSFEDKDLTTFKGYNSLGNVLFVNAFEEKAIE